MSDVSLYDECELELSQEELARLDEVANRAYELQEISALQAWLSDIPDTMLHNALEGSESGITTAAEPSSLSPPVGSPRVMAIGGSPYDQYRKNRGALSVTDVTGLAWCELQYDYGLRQMRHRKLEDRPTSFISALGKEITVSSAGKVMAASNEGVLERGKSVHRVLEREIRPEEVRVDVVTDEERWALRLVNMMFCLDDLLTGQRCREMPVFGLVHDQVITGIIDEINRHGLLVDNEPPPPTMSGKRPHDAPHQLLHNQKRSKRSTQPVSPSPTGRPSQREVTTSLITSLAKGKAKPIDMTDNSEAFMHVNEMSQLNSLPTHMLIISDTKTRRTPTLPSEEDTFSSRLQVMLYNRLLNRLLTDFDFPLFWMRVGVDRTRKLSLRFQTQTGLLRIGSSEHEATQQRIGSLADLERQWVHRVKRLDVDGVTPNMSLIYRTQPPGMSKEHKRKKRATIGGTSALAIQEQGDLEQAIRASLADSGSDRNDGPVRVLASQVPNSEPETLEYASDLVSDGGTGLTPLPEGTELAWAIQQSLLPTINVDGVSTTPGDNMPEISNTEYMNALQGGAVNSKIIGQKNVVMDDATLDDYVAHAFDWWHGRRRAVGVPLELSRRCFTCEYSDGCEWREQKAEEALRKATDRRYAASTLAREDLSW